MAEPSRAADRTVTAACRVAEMPNFRQLGEKVVGESLRLAERTLPVPLLRLLLWPPAAALAAYELSPARPTYRLFGRLPPSLRPPLSRWRWLGRLWARRTALMMTRCHRFWPDRLRATRWQGWCRVCGGERLDSLLAAGRSVILPTLHHGSLNEAYHWLRSRGLPVAGLAARSKDYWSPYRRHINSLADRANGMTGIPRFFEVDDVWGARDFLDKPGRLLLVAIDGYHGRRPVLARGPDFCVRVGAGVVRLAAIADAAVVPCLMTAPRGLAVELHFGNAVPEEHVADPRQHSAAAEYIVRELLPLVRARPEQCVDHLLRAFEGCS